MENVAKSSRFLRECKMGIYINPPNETKESFLRREGKPCSETIKWEQVPTGEFAVVYVDNGMFSAAGVLYSKQELEYWIDNAEDRRPKKFFLVPREKLIPVSRGLEHAVA